MKKFLNIFTVSLCIAIFAVSVFIPQTSFALRIPSDSGVPDDGARNAATQERGIAPKPTVPSVLLKPKRLPGPSQPEFGDDTPKIRSKKFFNEYLPGFVQRYLPGFLGVIAIFAVFGIIIGGVFMMTAYGNEERIGTAKKMIQWSIIGLLIAMLAFAIVNIIVRLPLPGT